MFCISFEIDFCTLHIPFEWRKAFCCLAAHRCSILVILCNVFADERDSESQSKRKISSIRNKAHHIIINSNWRVCARHFLAFFVCDDDHHANAIRTGNFQAHKTILCCQMHFMRTQTQAQGSTEHRLASRKILLLHIFEKRKTNRNRNDIGYFRMKNDMQKKHRLQLLLLLLVACCCIFDLIASI